MCSFQLYVCALHYRMLGYYGVRLTVKVWNTNLSAIQATFEIVVAVSKQHWKDGGFIMLLSKIPELSLDIPALQY